MELIFKIIVGVTVGVIAGTLLTRVIEAWWGKNVEWLLPDLNRLLDAIGGVLVLASMFCFQLLVPYSFLALNTLQKDETFFELWGYSFDLKYTALCLALPVPTYIAYRILRIFGPEVVSYFKKASQKNSFYARYTRGEMLAILSSFVVVVIYIFYFIAEPT